MAIVLLHQTPAEFAARLKAKFKASSEYEKGRIAARIYDWFIAGDLTQAQIRAAFGLDTTAKWTAFRDRLLALRTNYLALKVEQVEQ